MLYSLKLRSPKQHRLNLSNRFRSPKRMSLAASKERPKSTLSLLSSAKKMDFSDPKPLLLKKKRRMINPQR